MPRPRPLLLYSTNCLLAYQVNKLYYDDLHYVWVAEYAGSERLQDSLIQNPPTSRPLDRYRQLKAEFLAGDLHGPYIKEQKAGIRKGAQAKYEQGVVSEQQRNEILRIVDLSETKQYKPLLYVIPYSDRLEPLVKSVDVSDRAQPTCQEYIIEELPGRTFHILDLSDL